MDHPPRPTCARPSSVSRAGRAFIAAAVLCLYAVPDARAQTTLPPGFEDLPILEGLQAPTAVAFSPDGLLFVAEKAGIIKVFDGPGDDTPRVFADLRTEVNDYSDRGLLGLAVDPAFPARPFVYVLYTRDAVPGATTPTWGRPDADGDSCPDEVNGCIVTGRLARLEADGDRWTGRVDVLVDGWTQQFNSHSLGALVFGPDGALYASGGEGASWQFVDYGQTGSPVNPAGDPPAGVGGVMSPPTAEGGALRAQDLRTDGDPVGLSGSIIRIDPDTGEGRPDNPLSTHPDPNARRIVAYGFRNPFRFTVRPGTSQVWVGDVGWRLHEEINILPEPGAGVAANFGWPCYEGGEPQPGYQAAGLAICEQLYQESGAVTLPHFQYSRGGQVWPGDEACGSGNGSLSGMAFYDEGSYPAEYGGVLFFADYVRQCIWTMHPGVDGTPSSSDVRTFASGAAFPVDLKAGPGGDLFYVDIVGGTVRRIAFRGTAAPRAMLRIAPDSGSAPLHVQLDAHESFDPDGDALTYAWDLDGDGTFEPGDATLNHVFEQDGTYVVRLRVTDPAGNTDTASATVIVGAAGPTAVIETPSASLQWRAGRTYSFSGHATDPQEGTLDVSRLSWSLVMHHCSSPNDCHEHRLQRYDGVSGGSFVAPEHEYPSYLTIELVATDADGHQHATQRRLDPEPMRVVLQTEPAGLVVLLGDDRLVGGESRTVIAGSRQTVSAPSPQTLGGLPYVFSHWSDGGAASHLVAIEEDTRLTATFVPVVSGLPSGWTSSDIGDVGVAGGTSVSDGTFVLHGAGADVWDVRDAFHYMWRPLDGDGVITTRVVQLEGSDPWAKAGIMIRASLEPDAPHAFLLLSASNGHAFQRRHVAGGATAHDAVPSASWLRLERAGNLLTASISSDGATWHPAAQDTINLPAQAFVGLALTSHDATQLAWARFDSVAVTAAAQPGAWQSVDVGATGAQGGIEAQSDGIVVTGSGADIWGTEDAFHFAFQPRVGDLDITARVTRTFAAEPWAKFGLMVRASLAADSAHAFVPLTGSEGVAFQYRRAAGGATAHVGGGSSGETVWLRLVRTGHTFRAYRSADGVAWLLIGETEIVMPAGVLVGLAVTSHSYGASAIALFGDVTIGSGTAPTTSGWQSADVNTSIPGTTVESDGTVTLTAAGADVWGAADGFRYFYRTLSGNGTITARVASLSGPHRWSKAGVMIREALTPESPHGFMLVSLSRGITVQRRATFGGESSGSEAVDGTAPVWVRLRRQGAVLEAYYSTDGGTWTYAGTEVIEMADQVLVGLALTSHEESAVATTVIDNITVE